MPQTVTLEMKKLEDIYNFAKSLAAYTNKKIYFVRELVETNPGYHWSVLYTDSEEVAYYEATQHQDKVYGSMTPKGLKSDDITDWFKYRVPNVES